MEHFEIIGEIRDTEIIAVGRGIRDLAILEKRFGKANWRKLKGFATGSPRGWHDYRSRSTLVRSARYRRWIKIKRYPKRR